MNTQSTNTILMVRPASFAMNPQTAVNNHYQQKTTTDEKTVQARAVREFDDFVARLRDNGIDVKVLQDTPVPITPDALFPNNWFSIHKNSTAVLYPMFAPNRQQERRFDDVKALLGTAFKTIIDHTDAEKENKFLEGTGSMVLDRQHKKAYAAISPRTDKNLFLKYCDDLGYTPIAFESTQKVNGESIPIYHTNVMMSIGTHFAVICLESIQNKKERDVVLSNLQAADKEIIAIGSEQVYGFAGNVLEVKDKQGKCHLAMSQTAYETFTTAQIKTLKKYVNIIASPLNTIETLGGGSARCMMAEVF